MTTIDTPHSEDTITYMGFTIHIQVGFKSNTASETMVATANIYRNEDCIGAPFHHVSSQTKETVQEMVQSVCRRAKRYIDTWVADIDDIKDQMDDGIGSVFYESAIKEATE